MTRKMLVDATHAEETRVAVVDGQRLIEFDYESTVRKQLKGSIFLAKVTRVEPSLQAAFVNFGGNRHGFLPFSEIHTDYYRIPVADRDALLAEQKAALEAERRAEEEAERRAEEAALRAQGTMEGTEALSDDLSIESVEGDDQPYVPEVVGGGLRAMERPDSEEGEDIADGSASDTGEGWNGTVGVPPANDDVLETSAFGAFDVSVVESGPSSFDEGDLPSEARVPLEEGSSGESASEGAALSEGDDQPVPQEERDDEGQRSSRSQGRWRGRGRRSGGRMAHRSARTELVGADDVEEEIRPRRFGMRRQYKIQEVIKRGQIMLIQVSKEERGNKGAAVTTYLSLPGRYCVLMPNSPRGGGVSRKIANPNDRQKMKEILSDLNIPEGMSVILRTAGVARTKAEIRRDLDYLLNLWDEIRDLTLKSSAPSLIYEEASLIKRAVRDLYAPEIDEIIVSGDQAFRAARDFMKILMPSHEKKIVAYEDDRISLFGRHQIEQQIQAIGEPVVSLRSGGYLVINPTEALVSIDVNSGRATKERHIEETALKTNLEAADEVARQLRLRDLGGLVVIDFIDMEDRRNNARVERRLKEALSSDRARIQVGRISSFGLMELSRQRLNPSLTETQFEKCPHCKGTGNVRTLDSTAINALRALEEAGVAGRPEEVSLVVSSGVALYILNHKRQILADIERRYGFKVQVAIEEALAPAGFRIDSIRASVREQDQDEEDTDRSGERKDETDTSSGSSSSFAPRGRSRRSSRGGGRNEGRFADRANREEAASPEREEAPSPQPLSEDLETPDVGSDGGMTERESGLSRRRGRRGGRRGAPRRGGADGAGLSSGVSPDSVSWPEDQTRQPDPSVWVPVDDASGTFEDPDDNIGNRREDAPGPESFSQPRESSRDQSRPRRKWGDRSGGRRRPSSRDGQRLEEQRVVRGPSQETRESAFSGDQPSPGYGGGVEGGDAPAAASSRSSVTVRQPARRSVEEGERGGETPRPASAHETVNQSSGEKKRGWWNRFMEG